MEKNSQPEDSRPDNFNPDTLPGHQKSSLLSPEDIPIRKKTFNQGLEDILSRIRDNENLKRSEPVLEAEPHDSGSKPSFDNIDKTGRLYLLHRLFYRVKSLAFSKNLNRTFNLQEALVDEDRLPDLSGLFDLYCSYYTELFSDGVLLLAYDPEAHGYRGAVSKNMESDPDNYYVGLNDDLYLKTIKAPTGILLKADEIDNDPYIRKNLISGNSPGFSLYLVSLEKLFAGLNKETGLEEPGEPFLALYPVLIIYMQNFNLNTEEFFSRLKENIIPPVMFSHILNPGPFENRIDYRLIELLIAFTLFHENGCAYFLRADLPDIESFFIMKYLNFRIRSLYKCSVSAVMPSPVKSLIFSVNTIEEDIRQILDSLDFKYKLSSVPDEDLVDISLFYYKYIVKM